MVVAARQEIVYVYAGGAATSLDLYRPHLLTYSYYFSLRVLYATHLDAELVRVSDQVAALVAEPLPAQVVAGGLVRVRVRARVRVIGLGV